MGRVGRGVCSNIQLVSCIHPTHTLCTWSLLQPSLLLGHVLIVSGDFTITSVVLCPATASALRGNTGLTELGLERCRIDAEVTSHLAQALCVNTTLRVLDLSENPVELQDVEHLGKLSGGVWGYGLTVLTRYYAPFVYKPPLPFCTNSLRRYIYLQFKPPPPDHGRTLRLRRTRGRSELTVPPYIECSYLLASDTPTK